MSENEPGWRDDLDSTVLRMVEDALRKGASPDDVANGMVASMRESGRPIANDLIRDAPDTARDLNAQLKADREAVIGPWGDALDLFAAIISGVDEWYGDYHDRQAQDAAGVHDDLTFWILAGLMARAVRTGLEVYTMLCTGFPAGALARARTMHEIAVTAAAIGPNRDTDVAERYIAHADIASFRRMKLHQRFAKDLGFEPFTDSEVAAAKKAYDQTRGRYGRGFGGQYGWAVPLFDDNANPQIEDLENLVDLSLMRPWRKWADHEIHPTSHGSVLNLLDDHAGRHRITGPVTVGLADPAQVALIGLMQTFTIALVHGRSTMSRATDLTVVAAVGHVLDRALEAFVEAERQAQQPGPGGSGRPQRDD